MYMDAFRCGKGTYFYPRCHIVIDKEGKILIGNNCFFNNNCSINSMKKIQIGNDCIIGENVCFYDHNHEYKLNTNLIRKQGYNKKEIKIGNNCWIGSNVIILAGINIGNNVVIAAGTIVSKSIDDNCIVMNKSNLAMLPYTTYKNKGECNE